jgi:pyrimidine-nucleoside phosphorylase
MRDSGDKFDFSSTNRPKIDKHSTGGVGDKLSLLLVPLVVPCGLAVPMISGRGLGHTGGTLDKLDSIVGFNVRLEESDFYKLMQENFCFMASQTEDLVPADKKMYHIRDITGNVDSIGLITASILSKKLVEDLDGLVLDMKVGNGAFMRDFDSARELAESMAGVAREVGLKMRILFTSMEQPLGRKIGNWLEVEETIDALSGKVELP